MATLEDKILGEKLQNYCSSSESDNEDSGDESKKDKKAPVAETEPPLSPNRWEGSSTNTGPKGVIEDWRKFKRLETEKKQESEKEAIELAKKFTMTVRTSLEDERDKAALEDPELAELLNDEFLLNYQKERIKEMLHQTNQKKKFGELILLRNSEQFLDAIDQEDKTVTVVVHLYEEHVEACRTMNQCLRQLSKTYNTVKFLAIVASRAGVSQRFKVEAVPALLVYKSGNVIGNFVKLSSELGDSFQAEDVQGFLVEHGLLEDKSLTPVLIRSAPADGSDSD